MCHMPIDCEEESKKKKRTQPRCRLHHWALNGHEFWHKALHCPICEVNLCVHCYGIWHADRDPHAKKEELQLTLW